ncbi:MAG: response regulator transcription factor [Melioribacteraceae bacterium]|nr:response regulator transcription factor [Melioribacteraceae bacterium]
MKPLIYIIDDDEKLNSLINEYLSGYGYKIKSFENPLTALKTLGQNLPDLIILDIMLPEMNGFDVCKEIRKSFNVPIIMLTARGEVMDRIVGLELGADDYLPKPFEPRELLARIQSILRRVKGDANTEWAEFGELFVDFGKRIVTINGKQIELTTMEFELLTLFVRNSKRVLSRDSIMENLRGMEWEAYDRSVDVLISRLRQKLNDSRKNPKFIKTIWGTGYKFVGDEANES